MNNLLYTIFWISIYLLILAIIVGLIIEWFISRKRKKNILLEEYNLTFMQIKVPPQNEIEVKAAEHFFSNLTGFMRTGLDKLFHEQYRVSFEIVSKKNGIAFYVIAPDDIALLVEKQINAAYPEAEIDIVDPNEIWDRGAYTAVAEMTLSGPPYYPIKIYEDLGSDALSAITSSMSKMNDQEVLAVQYIIEPIGNSWKKAGRTFVGGVKAKASDPEKKVSVDTSFLEGVEKKIAKPGFNVAIRIIAIAENKATAESHIKSVASSFEQFTDLRYNKFKRGKISATTLVDNFIYRRINAREIFIPVLDIYLYRNIPLLNIEELATIFHFPNKDVQTPNIIWLGAKRSSAPSNLPDQPEPGKGVYFGKNIYRGVETPVYMLTEDRKRHCYIIGQTGTGKSEFMKSLAIQDIYNGEGLAIIDPHGSDIDDLLQKIPEERIEDVILFNAGDTERPLGLNILDVETEEEKHMIINAFIALLYKLYDPNHSGIMGPQLERSYRNVFLTAMSEKGATMVDVLRLLIDPKYAQNFLPKVQDPLVKRYWTDEIAKTSDYHKSEKMGYVVSKIDRFLTDITMRRIIAQPKSAIDFDKIMAEKKILLVDLSKGKIGEENSNFLGLMLVPRILAAAFKRGSMIGTHDFPNFFLYIDEFQNFSTPDIATILSEARKYKLNLVVAHQFIKQLSDDIKEAIFGNVGTMNVFRVGADDAEYLEAQFDPKFTKNDLINNPIGCCYTKMLIKGHPSAPFSMMVDWDKINATKKNPDIAARVIEYSRNTYGKSASEVDEYISKRAGFNEQPPVEEDAAGPFGAKKPRIPF